jgi:hypothetical protein
VVLAEISGDIQCVASGSRHEQRKAVLLHGAKVGRSCQYQSSYMDKLLP